MTRDIAWICLLHEWFWEPDRAGDLENMTFNVTPEGPVSLQILGLGESEFSK